jgi:TRAP-type mannitol/chloroaromatic compound transport system substrate-binding protein
MIEMAAGESITHTYAETEAKNFQAMAEMITKYKVANRRWDDEVLKTMEKAWLDVVTEESAKDPLFKKVADSYFKFRQDYKKWGEAQYLKPTYQ